MTSTGMGNAVADDTTCGQTQKIEIALYGACRMESQCPNGVGSHAVGMWFMRLHIVTETVPMMVENHSLPSHNAQSFRYTICQR